MLDPDDEIVEVTADCITVLKARRDRLRFPRHAASAAPVVDTLATRC